MIDKSELLSIGKVAKLTGASIKSLRYYEEIDILKPAYIDPHTSYRYYSFNQTYFIELLLLCIDFDIPLKEVSSFINGELVNVADLIAYGQKKANDKLSSLQKRITMMNVLQEKFSEDDKFPIDTVFSRELNPHYYKAFPIKDGYSIYSHEVLQTFSEEYFDYESDFIPDFGYLFKQTDAKLERYTIIEIDQFEENCEILPGGKYLCFRSNDSKLHRVHEIFGNKVGQTYLGIEVDLLTENYNATFPLKELRVINI
ncbi:MerR family DNA-binding transcriptional regulator [Enterococcus mundtii]|uniref:MerR family DNA-binding transcriptional regulator n=1 Tax=Enterococcus mundtii TaxID=53346 RepID=UPI001CF24B63|nr:MerR family DNA-binding transcriptional regulator [Enterococcus mundtii]MCA6775424.1 MerR family DNA-binding transcriptional regulator [Enterococcus mundtii]